MYPVLRLAKEFAVHAGSPPLDICGAHVSRHVCWPWDLDIWMELNNGRSLTLYDLGRLVLVRRIGLGRALARNGWGMTMAGASVRWRRRVRLFDRVRIVSRCVGWDARFIYVEQSMWKGSEAASAVIYRTAVTGPGGIVAPYRVLRAMGRAADSPPLPPHVAAWIDAEAGRPWPPPAGAERAA
jgi:acyl-CoA thioesterase FadM